jgi:hypothetical protein
MKASGAAATATYPAMTSANRKEWVSHVLGDVGRDRAA